MKWIHELPEFSGIAEIMNTALNAHGTAADPRRRTTVSRIDSNTKNGLRVKDLQQILFDRLDGLKERGFSLSSVRRMMVAPDKKTKSSKMYYGVVDAKVTPKRNTNVDDRVNRHYYRSEVKMLVECFEHFGFPTMSMDDMNAIQVGRPAVSRYHQNKSFFKLGKGKNYATHDFPHAKYNIKAGGMLIHEHKASYYSSRRRAGSA